MNGDRGYTLVELLVATAVMLMVTSAVMTMLHEGLVRTPVLEDSMDLHQRARIAADAIGADLRAAGNGTSSGPLSAVLPGVEPRWATAPSASASTNAVTVRYVPPLAARSRLAQPLDPASGVAVLEPGGCPQLTTACGFAVGMRAVVFDPSGQMDGLVVDAIGPGVLVLGAGAGSRSATYPTGSEIAQVVEASYVVDTATRQLRRSEAGGTFAIADNVEALTFEYFADRLATLPIAGFTDGPFRGSGMRMFDADLLGIRAVRATLRLSSGNPRAGAMAVTFTVSLRAGG